VQLSIIVYVSEMERSVAFYEALGFDRQGEIRPRWTAFSFGDTLFALHGTLTGELDPPGNRVTINIIVSREELDRLYTLSEARGYPVDGPIDDAGFGLFFRVLDPDGQPIQFNTRTR
jgi:catechol 2,3-dioxygenase-like lactoylglutathione lyase family enzyme